MLLSVPWFFINPGTKIYFGFPDWAFYTVVMSFLYSLSIYIYIRKYWE